MPRRRLLAIPMLLGLLIALTSINASSAYAASGPCPRSASNYTNLSVTVAPTTSASQVGTAATLTATVSLRGPVADVCVEFTKVSGPSAGWPRHVNTGPNGTATISWTSSSVGTDLINTSAQLANDGRTSPVRATHTWTAKPTPSPTRSPTRSPTPSPTPSATRSPTPSPTASPTPSPTTSPTPSPTPTPSPKPTTSAVPVVVPPGGHLLKLDKPSTVPGGTVSVSGQYCPPGVPVAFTVLGKSAGRGTSTATGSFTGVVQLPDAPIGEYQIDVTCGNQKGSVPIDLVVSSSASGSPGAATTTAAVLLFFMLLAGVLLNRDGSRSGREPLDPSA